MHIWIGKYYSDIKYSNVLFDIAITLYTPHYTTEIPTFSFPCIDEDISINSNEYTQFVYQTILTVGLHNDMKLFFYSDSIAIALLNMDPNLSKYIFCCNMEQHSWLSSKSYQRLLLKSYIDMPPFVFLPGNECTLEIVKQKFPMISSFVVQDNYSSGGHGTFFLNSKNPNLHLNTNVAYLVSPQVNGKSCNIHIIITKKDVIIFPWSIQKLNIDNNDATYHGALFSTQNKITEAVVKMVNNIAQKLRMVGYRGICGIDFLLDEGNVYFIEINCRFQGSSMALDKYLNDVCHHSLYNLHMQSFNDDFVIPKDLTNMTCISYDVEYQIIKNCSFIPDSNCSVVFRESKNNRIIY